MRLNNVEVAFTDTRYEQELAKGDHIIQWYVEGPVDALFGISISSPPSAEFDLITKLDVSGKDFGGFRFKV